MSTLIPCPHCGDRPVQEFRYGSEAPASRPQTDSSIDPVSLSSLLYDSVNPKGLASEWWHHTAGCRLWFAIQRDTATDLIAEASA